ncbi:acyl-CoA dehydrogenase/oxidase [Cladochytrium replicatum]|nr:acyl-CoA dehydrogenase/oxidase [Cladochytrium replicatum]
MATRKFTVGEVAKHNTANSAWIIVDQKVYDVTKFQNDHPGGKGILLKYAGKDASKEFHQFHQAYMVLPSYGPKLEIGVVGEAAVEVADPNKPELSGMLITKENEVFGDLTPFAEPAWYQDWYSPYFKESHIKLRAHMRKWLQENSWMEHKDEWERLIKNNEKPPKWAFEAVGKAGIFRVIVGPPWGAPNVPGIPSLPMGIPQKEWDIFHEMVVVDELNATPSLVGVMFGGNPYALPLLMKYGTQKMKDEIVPALFNGTETAALAISEPHAGSDVAQLQTRAVLSADGKHFVLNGEKKWITGGVWADWFMVACRTDDTRPGSAGISVLAVRRGPGLTTRPIETQSGVISGTAYVTFDNMIVPAENLVGKLNGGFKLLMANFNHERLFICITTLRNARVCYQEAVHYCHKRKTFGKFLIQHPILRDKLAHMARQIEAAQAWVESIAYQMQRMPTEIQDARLGGVIALAKVQCTNVFEFCAKEASQILGGISVTKGGQGARVEQLYRVVRSVTIAGGSQEIMADLGIRQSLKVHELMGAKL